MKLKRKKHKKNSAWLMLRNMKWNTLYKRYFAQIMGLTGLPIVLVCLACLYIYSTSMYAENKDQSISMITKISDAADSNVNEILTGMRRITSANEMDAMASGDRPNEQPLRVAGALDAVMADYGFIDGIYIYSDTTGDTLSVGRQQMNGGVPFTRSWVHGDIVEYDKYFKMRKRQLVGDPVVDILTIYQDIFEDGRRVGVLMVNIDMQKFTNQITSAYDNVRICLFDPNGERLYAGFEDPKFSDYAYIEGLALTSSPLYFSGDNTNSDNSYTGKRTTLTNWSIVMQTQLPKALQSVGMIVVLISIILFTVVLSLLLSVFVSLRMFRPFMEIINVIDKSSVSGDEAQYEDEVEYIISTISTTIDNYNDVAKELSLRLQLLKQAQAKALQAQITPHFIYNTLANIGYMSKEKWGGKNEISDALFALTSLFKYSMQSSQQLTMLSDEIEHAQRYVDIQKIRYKDFDVQWHFYGDVLQYYTIKLVLQPIIENAIYHGIKPLGGGGIIIVEAKKINNKLMISVEDNGVGISDQTISRLDLKNMHPANTNDEHIGVGNVNARIKLLFGNMYGIRVENEKNTKVIIEMPLIAKKRGEIDGSEL